MTKWTQWTDSEIYLYCLGIGLAMGTALGAFVWSTGAGIGIGLALGIVWAEWLKTRRNRRHEQRGGQQRGAQPGSTDWRRSERHQTGALARRRREGIPGVR